MQKVWRAWRLWLIIAILALVGYAVFWHDTAAPAVQQASAYDWRFNDQGERDNIPRTEVVLRAGGKSYTIGTYEGSCAEMPGDYLEYEVSKVICWYAGGGHEVGVFEEPGQVVVRVGEVDEGASGIEGFRGNFTLVKTIE